MKFFKIRTKPHKIDVILIILFPVAAAVLTLIFKTNFLISTLLFFGVPSLYLCLRKPGIVFKSLIFTTIFSIPLVIVMDYLAIMDKSWIIPSSLFNFRFFGTNSIEGLIWGFLYVFFIIMFYEYFLDFGKKEDRVSKNTKYLIAISLSVLTVFLLFLFVSPGLLHIKYFYLKSGTILILLPLVTFLSFFPKLWTKYVKIGVYFFGLSLLHEVAGLHTNQWTFPGHNFIGFVELFGLKFPFEELLFWMILCAAALLSYYEFFADDKK